MSDAPAPRDALDLEAVLVQLAKSREETRKFVAEQHKLMAEGNKFNRDRWIVPLTVLITVAGSIIVGVIISLPAYLHLLGWVKP